MDKAEIKKNSKIKSRKIFILFGLVMNTTVLSDIYTLESVRSMR